MRGVGLLPVFRNADEFFRIEGWTSKPKKFIAELGRRCEAESTSLPVIQYLRASGACVDVYGTTHPLSLIASVRSTLESRFGLDDVHSQSYIQQVESFNLLFDHFRAFWSSVGVDDIHKKRQVISYLIALEIAVASGREYAIDSDLDLVKAKYPTAFVPMDEGKRLLKGHEASAALLDAIDHIAELSGTVLGKMAYAGYPMTGHKTTISRNDLNQAIWYIRLSQIWDRLIDAFEIWRFAGATISGNGINEFNIEPCDPELIRDWTVSNARFQNMRSVYFYQAVRTDMSAKFPIHPDTDELPPTRFRGDDEVLSWRFLQRYFGSEGLTEEVAGLSLACWLRAYTVITEVAQQFIAERSNMAALSVAKWCLVQSRQEWASKLVSAGIAEELAESLLDKLSFGRGAKDLFDRPLIPIDDKLAIVPSITASIDPARALFSNLISKDDVSVRGYAFEDEVRGFFNDHGIQCTNLLRRVNDESYECDAIFDLDGDLYLVECKSHAQPATFRQHYIFELKLDETCAQLNRYADFFSGNMMYVREALGKPADWQPDEIVKLVVCNPRIARPYFIEGCHVVDAASLDQFLSRQPPGVVIGDKRMGFDDGTYTGEVTSAKLKRYLKSLPNVGLLRAAFAAEHEQMKFGTTSVRYHEWRRLIRDYTVLADRE